MIRVTLPPHLRNLVNVQGEFQLTVSGPVTQRSVIDALEMRYPMLKGTIRYHSDKRRRPMVRFFACGRDLSNEPPDVQLPDEVAGGNGTSQGRWRHGRGLIGN